MPVDCWIVLITTYKSDCYRCLHMLITLKLRILNPVDKNSSYPQEKLSTACDRSYRDLIQHLLCVKFKSFISLKMCLENE